MKAMISSLSLSLDMGTLTIIDSGGTKTNYDLSANDGIIISFVQGDIKVDAAKSKPSPDAIASLNNAQWQISFNSPTNIAFLVGSIDITVNAKPKHYEFNLNNGNLQLWKDGSDLKAKLL